MTQQRSQCDVMHRSAVTVTLLSQCSGRVGEKIIHVGGAPRTVYGGLVGGICGEWYVIVHTWVRL